MSLEHSDELQRMCADAMNRMVRTLVSSSAGCTLHKIFQEGELPIDERLASAKKLNEILADELRAVQQEASARQVTLPVVSTKNKELLSALAMSLVTRNKLSVARSSSTATTQNSSVDTVPSLHFERPAVRTKKAKKIDVGTSTSEDAESDPNERLRCVAAAKESLERSTTISANLSSALSRKELVSNAVRGALCGHWFWHASLRHAEMMTPSVCVGCSREGILLTASQDANRAGLRDLVSLGGVKSISLGMTPEAFRAWKEWESYKAEQRQKALHAVSIGRSATINPSELDTTTMFGGDQENKFVRRSLTITLREPRQSQLFGLWHSDITIAFVSLDDYSAFLAAFTQCVSYVQWNIDPMSLIEPPQLPPPTLVGLLARAVAGGDLAADEVELCSKWHIFPDDVEAVKRRLTSVNSPKVMGIEDLFDIAPSMDVLQMLLVVRKMSTAGLVTLHTVLRCL